ncbi:hypothetical protein BJX64DRAFT_249306, partial [Aspergillus heterothallicus]
MQGGHQLAGDSSKQRIVTNLSNFDLLHQQPNASNRSSSQANVDQISLILR